MMDENETRKFANGWRLIDWDVLKRPPVWFAASCHILAFAVICLLLFLTISALWRLAVGTGDYDHQAGADHARNLLIAVGAIVAAPFVVWRTWISHQQWVTSANQVNIQNDTLQTSLLTKAVELLSFKNSDRKPNEETHSEAYNSNKIGLESRLGALSILKRIAASSAGDHIDILEIIAAFLREYPNHNSLTTEKTPTSPQPGDSFRQSKSAQNVPREGDFKKALSILGDARLHAMRSNNRLNSPEHLYAVSIKSTDLSGMLIENYIFDYMDFSDVNFSNSILTSCSFKNSILRGAKFNNTEFGNNVSFYGADFSGCDLSSAGNLKIESLIASRGDANSSLPDYINIVNLNGQWDKKSLFQNYFSEIYYKLYAAGGFISLDKNTDHLTALRDLAFNYDLNIDKLEHAYIEIYATFTGTPLPRNS